MTFPPKDAEQTELSLPDIFEGIPPFDGADVTATLAEEARLPPREHDEHQTLPATEHDEHQTLPATEHDEHQTLPATEHEEQQDEQQDAEHRAEQKPLPFVLHEAIADASASAENAEEQEKTRRHLKGLFEALIFVSDKPIRTSELAKTAAISAPLARELLLELKGEFTARGVQLDEIAGGWLFRTNAVYASYVRDLSKVKPVRLTRAQVETLAILAYRQPITRPEIDDIRGVDCGAVLKLLLERDLIRILGTKDEPGRPILYGTTPNFLEFFGLRSLKDLPTLKEFTELNEDSRKMVERELGSLALNMGDEEAAPTAETATAADFEDDPTFVGDSLATDSDATAEVETAGGEADATGDVNEWVEPI